MVEAQGGMRGHEELGRTGTVGGQRGDSSDVGLGRCGVGDSKDGGTSEATHGLSLGRGQGALVTAVSPQVVTWWTPSMLAQRDMGDRDSEDGGTSGTGDRVALGATAIVPTGGDVVKAQHGGEGTWGTKGTGGTGTARMEGHLGRGTRSPGPR